MESEKFSKREGDSDFKESSEVRRFTRRKFLARLGWWSFLLAIGGFFTGLASYLLPKMNYEPSSAFTIGRPEDYHVGHVKLNEANRVYIFRNPQGFQAISAACTHLGCTYNPHGPADEQFAVMHAHCPCHGSVFHRDGRVLGGPAPRPLPFYHMGLTSDGHLFVDKAVKDLSDELSDRSGEGVAHDLYLDPKSGQMIRGPLPG